MKDFDLNEIKETENYLLKVIQDVVCGLNIIDEMIETIGSRQSKVDSILSDYTHLLEENNTNKNTLSDESYIKIAKEIELNRKKRRHLKNEFELSRVYTEQKEKLFYKEHRQFFINEIHRRFTELNQPYKPRILTEKEVEMLLVPTEKDEKKEISRIRKERVY